MIGPNHQKIGGIKMFQAVLKLIVVMLVSSLLVSCGDGKTTSNHTPPKTEDPDKKVEAMVFLYELEVMKTSELTRYTEFESPEELKEDQDAVIYFHFESGNAKNFKLLETEITSSCKTRTQNPIKWSLNQWGDGDSKVLYEDVQFAETYQVPENSKLFLIAKNAPGCRINQLKFYSWIGNPLEVPRLAKLCRYEDQANQEFSDIIFFQNRMPPVIYKSNVLFVGNETIFCGVDAGQSTGGQSSGQDTEGNYYWENYSDFNGKFRFDLKLDGENGSLSCSQNNVSYVSAKLFGCVGVILDGSQFEGL